MGDEPKTLIEGTLMSILSRLDSIDQCCKRTDTNVTELRSEMVEFKEEVNKKIQVQDDKIATLETRVSVVEKSKDDLVNENVKKNLMREMYDKRFNLLILGAKDNNVNESREETKSIVLNFMEHVLQIPDWHEITLIDAHRLPQKVDISYSSKVQTRRAKDTSMSTRCRPIIIQLANMFDVNKLWSNRKNLYEFNNDPTNNDYRGYMFYCSDRNASNRLSLTRHLPRVLQDKKKQYGDKQRVAIRAGKKTRWEIDFDNADIHLIIDNKRVAPVNS